MDENAAGRRVAIVTGAGGGLGAEICRVLKEADLAVLPVDIAGENVLAADVGTADGNRRMVEKALEQYGRLDVLVLNAAVQYVAPLPDFPVEEWDRLMDVVLKGPFLAMKYAWSALTAQPGGRIIVTASTSSFVAEPYKPAYISAKHGILGLVRAAAVEAGPHGLTVNAVAPGLMITGLIEGQLPNQMRVRGCSREEVIAAWTAAQAIKRPVEVREVANMIGFLASPASSGITGACIPVDLGQLAMAP